MIFDPEIEVMCDRCDHSIFIKADYKYYDWGVKAIEKKLMEDFNWKCDDGKHYCKDCVEEIDEEISATDIMDEDDWISDSDMGAK